MSGEQRLPTVAELEDMLASDPKNMDIKIDLAKALLDRYLYGSMAEENAQVGEEDDISQLRAILPSLPKKAFEDPEVMYSQAFVAYMEGHDNEALSWISKWAEVFSQEGEPLNASEFQGILRYVFGTYQPTFWSAIANGFSANWQDSAVAHHLRGLAEKGLRKQLTWYKIALEKDGGFWVAALDCGAIYCELNQWQDGHEMIQIVLQDDDARESYEPYNIDAICLHGMKQYANEELALRNCLDRDFNTPDIQYRLGRCLYLQYKYTEALEAINAGMSLDPSSIALVSLKIQTLRRQGANDQAQQEIDKLGDIPTKKPATYLLTWNPRKYRWWDRSACIREVQDSNSYIMDWSCGRTKRIVRGDRVYLLRQGQDPKGIMASGTVLSSVIEGQSWDPSGSSAQARYVITEWDMILDPESQDLLSRDYLLESFPSINWNTQISGISIPPDVAVRLDEAWTEHLHTQADKNGSDLGTQLPEEIVEAETYPEGAVKRIWVNAYERNSSARNACIRHFGPICTVCGFNFEQVYGSLGKGFIHVHHLRPLANSKGSGQIDPVEDLRPVCPNCHAMLHRQNPPLSIEELRNRITS